MSKKSNINGKITFIVENGEVAIKTSKGFKKLSEKEVVDLMQTISTYTNYVSRNITESSVSPLYKEVYDNPIVKRRYCRAYRLSPTIKLQIRMSLDKQVLS